MIVFPSWMNVNDPKSYQDSVRQDFTLKWGQVIGVIYPEPTSGGFLSHRYNVATTDYADGVARQKVYFNCPVMDKFGSIADFEEYSLRATKVSDSSGSQDSTQAFMTGKNNNQKTLDGAQVLLLCLNANANQGYIIGAVRNPDEQTKENYTPPTKDDGIFYTFSFNGVNFAINKDGELNITRNGPQNDKGQLVSSTDAKDFGIDAPDAKTVGNFITFKKDGSVIINSMPNNNQIILKDGEMQIKLGDGNSIDVKNKDSDTTCTIGDGQMSVAIAENLQTLYTNLKAQFDTFAQSHFHTSSPSGGPTTPPTVPVTAPPWDSSIVSSKVKIPNG